MATNVTEKDEMFFLGMEEAFASVADHDADRVMFKRFMPHAAAFEKHAIDDGLYALGKFLPDGSCTYMVGKRVAAVREMPADLPAGSVYRTMPASSYVEIETSPHELGEEEQKKAAIWFKEHPEYQAHPVATGIEYYPKECRGVDDPMWTWYPIVPAGD